MAKFKHSIESDRVSDTPRGEGSLGTPKSDYVICARPLMCIAHFGLFWSKCACFFVGETLETCRD